MKSKKLLSLVLAVIMIACTVPMAYAEGGKYKVGDIIQFGSYPQSEVKDFALIAELGALAPAWENWTSYDYYWDLDGAVMQMSWMRYIDVEYGGNKYRGVKFIEYRNGGFTRQDDNGYFVNMTYWFKFEPIEWRVLDPETGFVLCETIIDTQAFSNTSYFKTADDGAYICFNDPDYENYANDYETSSIRKWLNDDFYNTAFTDNEKKEISITTLNNDVVCSGEPAESRNETKDKIFLLSYEDTQNSDFGFVSHVNLIAQSSDYAECQGVYDAGPAYGYDQRSPWHLRTPGIDTAKNWYIEDSGYTNCFWVDGLEFGVRPALKINDINNLNHKHDYKTKVYAPTCTTYGYTVYTCECGDAYEADRVDKLPHKDTNGDYKCDYGCGYTFEKPAEPCSCNCHAGGIKAFFFKIILFFQKLFKKNAVCACGAAHY
ncbi:MAG: hypothetical protein IJC79_01315 [Clostridia bacterium]|nr:hypothetical protein [Clostridia bacterium]